MFSRVSSLTEREICDDIFVPGLEKAQKLSKTFISIQDLLNRADKRQLKEEPVWLERLRNISCEIEDVLDMWKTVQLKLEIIDTRMGQNQTGSYQSSYCSWLKDLPEKRDLQGEIDDLNERLEVINQEKEVYKFQSETTAVTSIALQRAETSAFGDVSEVFGRDQEIELIKTKLLTSFSQASNIDIISIVGMGGMGKTTIARRIFDEFEKHFKRMIWVCVSDPYNDIRVAKSIIEELGGDSRSCSSLQSSLSSIKRSIAGVKFMLVLDDVWAKDIDWEPLFNVLKTGARGSKILVTSRNMEVAIVMESCYTHNLMKLSKDESWTLFSKIAFSNKREDKRKKLEVVGKSIAEKCEGLPLALKTLATHLKFTAESEWHKVLHSDLWKLKAAEEGIFVPLLFSYYELSLAIKKCFSYCAIFPKDHRIEVKELVRLWMSQDYLKSSTREDMELRMSRDYLNSSTSEEMETMGQNYFEHLVTRSFFQDFEYHEDTGAITYCKMHDIVHDFAQFLSKNESLIIDRENKGPNWSSSSCRKLRHVTVLNAVNSGVDVMLSSFSSSIQRLHLHTLRISRSSTIGEIGKNFQNLSQHLCFIKALDLSENEIVKIPEEIGQFVHLRYLDLSRNSKLERLPETIYELCNLQTLLLNECKSLRELPEGIEKLINLRHLANGNDAILPRGIGSLYSLRTLSRFYVTRDEGHDREVAAAAIIGDLRNLNNLQGILEITHLKNVKDGRKAEKAELRNKRGLTGLILDFHKGEGIGGHENEVIEALEPCHNLETLEIWFYRGNLLPSWISSLSKLRILHLFYFNECEELPPLGQLPSLEELVIQTMRFCKRIGDEFLGIKRPVTSTGGGGCDGKKIMTSSVVVAFPKLKLLSFGAMRGWTEWEDVFISGENDNYEDDGDLNFKLFPCLDELLFQDCRQLKSLPKFISKSPIQTLEIWDCPILEKRCRPEVGEDWSKISHIPNITVYNSDHFRSRMDKVKR